MGKQTEVKKKIAELKKYLGIERQADLAKELGLRRSVISKWERSTVSTEGFLKLASVAPPELGGWFLERAAEKAGLPLRKLDRIVVARAFNLPAHADESKALRLEIEEETRNPLFSPGDVVFLDTRAIHSEDLQDFWQQLVLLQFPEKPEALCKPDFSFLQNPGGLAEYLHDPRVIEDGARQTWPKGKRFGVLRPYLVAPFGVMAQFEDLEALSFSKFGPGIQSQTVGFFEIPKKERAAAEQLKKAPPMRLFGGLQLLGRVVAWEKKK